jgi:hypothetical protein
MIIMNGDVAWTGVLVVGVVLNGVGGDELWRIGWIVREGGGDVRFVAPLGLVGTR